MIEYDLPKVPIIKPGEICLLALDEKNWKVYYAFNVGRGELIFKTAELEKTS